MRKERNTHEWEEILDFIIRYWRTEKRFPMQIEIAEGFNYSRQLVKHHLNNLVAKKHIKVERGRITKILKRDDRRTSGIS